MLHTYRGVWPHFHVDGKVHIDHHHVFGGALLGHCVVGYHLLGEDCADSRPDWPAPHHAWVPHPLRRAPVRPQHVEPRRNLDAPTK